MGVLSGLAGFVLASRLYSAEAVVGVVLIGVLLNGLVLPTVSSYIRQIVIGLIIVLAVAFDTFAQSRRRRV